MAILKQDFETIVRVHQAMLYRIAFNFLRNVHIAEEVVQDVLLQLYESDPEIESMEHLKAWLRRAATHRCIDLVRRRSFQIEAQVDAMPDVAGETGENDPLLDERVRTMVASLPETQRMVVILRYGEDMTSDEIALVLDMPSPTVRSHLQRALALLREKAPQILGERVYESI